MRQRLRKKEAKRISSAVREKFGIEITGDMDLVTFDDRRVILVNGEPVLFEHDGGWYPTVLCIIKNRPSKGRVVVDEGAVPYVINGADIMRPGIVEADPEIEKGDFVYITVEVKDTPLAVGIALTDGSDMIGEKGKVIENIHHVKDKIWNHFFGR